MESSISGPMHFYLFVFSIDDGTCRQTVVCVISTAVWDGMFICSIAILSYSIDEEWPMQTGADPTKMSVGVNFQGNVGASDKVNISFFTQDFRK